MIYEKTAHPQEKFEYTRKIFYRFLIGLVFTSLFSALFTILYEFTDIFEGRNDLIIAPSILLAVLHLFYIASALILFVRLKKIAATMMPYEKKKQSDDDNNEET